MSVKITELSNKLRFFVDETKDVDTVTVVLGVQTGSRNETLENNGISHFLEHMAFKGTKTRTYKQIAEVVDNVGGVINAYTSKEMTAYYVKLMKEDVGLAIDILSDIFQNSIFPEEEIEKEKGVILQELSSTLDTPDDVVFDYFHEVAFKNSTLSKTILGTEENIKKFTKNDFVDYISSRYSVKNSALAICGNVNYDEIFKASEKYLSNLPFCDIETNVSAKYSGGYMFKNKKDLEQMQCLIGFESLNYMSDDYHKAMVLSSILGSGMSSRLFQEIREKRGLVYTISCWNDSYCDTGVFTIYAGTSPSKVDELILAVKDELLKICESITDEEMNRVLKQTQSGIAMTKESTSARAKKGCSDLLLRGNYLEYGDILKKIANITKNDVLDIAEKIFANAKPSLVLYGDMSQVKSEYQDFTRYFEK